MVLESSCQSRGSITALQQQAKHDAWNLHEDNIFDIFMRLAAP